MRGTRRRARDTLAPASAWEWEVGRVERSGACHTGFSSRRRASSVTHAVSTRTR